MPFNPAVDVSAISNGIRSEDTDKGEVRFGSVLSKDIATIAYGSAGQLKLSMERWRRILYALSTPC